MGIEEVFDNFRPIYIFFIVIMIIIFAIILFQKMQAKIINGFSLVIILVICWTVSLFLTYQVGILSDELVISGDPTSFIMLIIVIVISIVNIVVYYSKTK